MTTAGQTIVFVNLLPTTKAQDVAPTWAHVRNMIADIQATSFPPAWSGAVLQRPFRRRLRQYLRLHRRRPDGTAVARPRRGRRAPRSSPFPMSGHVDLVGAQDEAIYLEFSTRQVAALGLDPQAILASLRAQNAIAPSGFHAGRSGADRDPRRGAVHVRRKPAGDQSARQRPLLSPDRCRDDPTRLWSIRR